MRCPTCGATEQVSKGFDSDYYCWECCTSFSRRLLEMANAKNASIIVPAAIAVGVGATVVLGGLNLYKWIKNRVS